MFNESALSQSLAGLGIHNSRPLFTELQQAYGSSGRYYHDQSHVAACLTQLSLVSHLADKPHEVAVALWFHDAVYDATKQDNEARSADWASAYLSAEGVSEAVIKRIHNMIMATQTHQPKTDDEALLTDIDLGVLGASESSFEAYEQGIRNEYHWAPIDAYVVGRVEVLQSFLACPRIYHTQHFYDLLEQTARQNLMRKVDELSQLTSL
ncbi:hypothetical protein EOL70_11580 [Leucothrix sargassi]|nr:hypothetical protein EOL70_11580 [Leucothrix sargassi]